MTSPARVVAAVATGLAGLAACGLAILDDPRRPVLTMAGLAALWVVAAVVTGWRSVGTVAVAFVTAASLLALALDPGSVRVSFLGAATLLILCFVAGLDQVERSPVRRVPYTVAKAPLSRRAGLPLLAFVPAVVVAVAAAQPVVPSAGLVLLGLAAGVGALVLATRAH